MTHILDKNWRSFLVVIIFWMSPCKYIDNYINFIYFEIIQMLKCIFSDH